MPRSDAELIRAAREGEEPAFAELYQRHRDWVVAVAMRCCGQEDEALELLQETFAYLIRRLPQLELQHQLRSLLYPVIQHLARDRRKQRQRETGRFGVEDPDSLPDPRPTAPEPDALDHLLQRLDTERRQLLELRFVDGLSLQEIADALDLPLGTVKSRLHSTLAQLRAQHRSLD